MSTSENASSVSLDAERRGLEQRIAAFWDDWRAQLDLARLRCRVGELEHVDVLVLLDKEPHPAPEWIRPLIESPTRACYLDREKGAFFLFTTDPDREHAIAVRIGATFTLPACSPMVIYGEAADALAGKLGLKLKVRSRVRVAEAPRGVMVMRAEGPRPFAAIVLETYEGPSLAESVAAQQGNPASLDPSTHHSLTDDRETLRDAVRRARAPRRRRPRGEA